MKQSRVKETLVIEAIKILNDYEKKEFGFFCMDRIINLYKGVDSRIDIREQSLSIETGTAYITLKSIYNDLKEGKYVNSHEIKDKIKICDGLILDTEEFFENSVENVSAQIVATTLFFLLHFQLERDDQYIIDCSDNIIEIINQLMSWYFYNNISDNDELCLELLEPLFIKEYDIQLKSIDLIKEGDRKGLNKLIKETIVYNINIQ